MKASDLGSAIQGRGVKVEISTPLLRRPELIEIDVEELFDL